MKDFKFYLFTLIFFCAAFPSLTISAQTPPAETRTENTTPTPTPENSASDVSESAADLIHPGDLIDVDVVGSTEYDWRGKLNPEGFLNGIDYVENPIYGLCRSETAVAESVAKAYAKILRAPSVVVKILDRSNRPLSMLFGAVKTPQRFQIKRPFYLNELLIVGGGLTDRASGDIQIYRPPNANCQPSAAKNSGANETDGASRERYVLARQDNGATYLNIKIGDLLAGKKEANPQILSGDVVTVQEAEAIYVIGGVANPKQISSRAQMTVTRAVASAGGISKGGDAKRVTIFRRAAGETVNIETDLDKIKAGQSEDVILKAFDIVEVAQSKGEKRKFPPVLKIAETEQKSPAVLPLRVID